MKLKNGSLFDLKCKSNDIKYKLDFRICQICEIKTSTFSLLTCLFVGLKLLSLSLSRSQAGGSTQTCAVLVFCKTAPV